MNELEPDRLECHVIKTPLFVKRNPGDFISHTQISEIRAQRSSRTQEHGTGFFSARAIAAKVRKLEIRN
jgi:hypothetical protein